jgi:ankyrin repeat protein
MANEASACAEVLLGRGAKVNVRNRGGWTPLVSATKLGQDECVRVLIEKGADVNFPASDGTTPLIAASRLRSPSLLKMLLAAGADATAVDWAGRTALDSAIASGRPNLVQLLQRAAPNVQSSAEDDPLLRLVRTGTPKEVRRLLRQRSDLPQELLDTALVFSLDRRTGSIKMLRTLLAAGANASTRDATGRPVLCMVEHCASVGVSGVEALLAAGADVDATDALHGGVTALHSAARGSTNLAAALIEGGANVDAVADGGETPLFVAVRHGAVPVVVALVRAGAAVDAQTADGESVFEVAHRARRPEVIEAMVQVSDEAQQAEAASGGVVAIRRGSSTRRSLDRQLLTAVADGKVELVRWLLKVGASADGRDESGRPALLVALKAGATMVRLLLEAGVDVDARPRSGPTALNDAAARYPHLVPLLLDAGASTEVSCEGGETALVAAVQSGEDEVVSQLLEVGANPNVVLDNGQTVLALAVDSGTPETVRILLEAGADVAAARSADGRSMLEDARQQNSPVVGSMADVLRAHGSTIGRKKRRRSDEVVELSDSSSPSDSASSPPPSTPPPASPTPSPSASTNSFETQEEGQARQSPLPPSPPPATVDDLVDAAARGDGGRIRELLDSGVDVNGTAESGQTALHATIGTVDDDGVVLHLLLADGAHRDARNRDGCTALYLACARDPIRAQLLLVSGADVSARCERGRTPLHSAVQAGSVLIVSRLLQAGAQVNVVDDDGYTPLIVAATRGSRPHVQILLGAGADVTQTLPNGDSALAIATREGKVAVALLLKQVTGSSKGTEEEEAPIVVDEGDETDVEMSVPEPTRFAAPDMSTATAAELRGRSYFRPLLLPSDAPFALIGATTSPAFVIVSDPNSRAFLICRMTVEGLLDQLLLQPLPCGRVGVGGTACIFPTASAALVALGLEPGVAPPPVEPTIRDVQYMLSALEKLGVPAETVDRAAATCFHSAPFRQWLVATMRASDHQKDIVKLIVDEVNTL